MSNLILTIIVIVALSAVVVLLNMSKKDKSGSKGITDEYKSKDGVTRTAKKEREDHIV
jgi:preprotein translocase subunit SecG